MNAVEQERRGFHAGSVQFQESARLQTYLGTRNLVQWANSGDFGVRRHANWGLSVIKPIKISQNFRWRNKLIFRVAPIQIMAILFALGASVPVKADRQPYKYFPTATEPDFGVHRRYAPFFEDLDARNLLKAYPRAQSFSEERPTLVDLECLPFDFDAFLGQYDEALGRGILIDPYVHECPKWIRIKGTLYQSYRFPVGIKLVERRPVEVDRLTRRLRLRFLHEAAEINEKEAELLERRVALDREISTRKNAPKSPRNSDYLTAAQRLWTDNDNQLKRLNKKRENLAQQHLAYLAQVKHYYAMYGGVIVRDCATGAYSVIATDLIKPWKPIADHILSGQTSFDDKKRFEDFALEAGYLVFTDSSDLGSEPCPE